MTGQTLSNERGAESSGFVMAEFSDYRGQKNSVTRGAADKRMSVTKTK